MPPNLDESQNKAQSFSRDFKGIWIPKELWLDHRLSFFEKCLLAEIDSLDGSQGCYASNSYFEKFFNVNARTLQRGIAKLKSLGLIEVALFNGRQRVLRSCLKIYHDKFDTSAMTPQIDPDKNVTSAMTNLSPPPSGSLRERENIIDNKVSPSLTNVNSGESARARSKQIPKEKKTEPKALKETSKQKHGDHVELTVEEYENLCLEMGKDLVDHYIEAINLWVPNNRKYKAYAAAIRSWRKRDEESGKNIIPLDKAQECKEENAKFVEIVNRGLRSQDRIPAVLEIENNKVKLNCKLKDQSYSIPLIMDNKNFKTALSIAMKKLGLDSSSPETGYIPKPRQLV